MKAIDSTSGKELALDLALADTLRARLQGLLGRDALPAGTGLWIRPCNSIHTFGMRFPIDALFLDREKRVVGLAKDLPPNRMSRIYPSARSVMELPAGTLQAADTLPGDLIEVLDAGPSPGRNPVDCASFFLYLLLLAANLALVWALPFFPTQDGPSHVYNLVILNDLLHGGKVWGEFYTYQLHAEPNLGFHLICFPLLQFFSPFGTERIFVSLYVILMAACVPFFLSSFDKRIFPLSFLVFPVIFNFTTMMGFYSYTIAVPLFFLALSVSWRIHNSPAFYRFIALNLMGIVIYVCHVIPFILFLLSIVALPLTERKGSKEKLFRTIKEVTLTSPLFLISIIYLTRGSKSPFPGFSYLFSVSRLATLFSELLLFSTTGFSLLQLVPSVILIVTIYLLAKPGFMHYRSTRNLSVPDRYISGIIIMLLLIYFAAPFYFGGGSFFNERFPWVIYLLSLPLFRSTDTATYKHAGILIVSLSFLFTLSNSYFLGMESGRIKNFVGSSSIELPKGSQVMMYKSDRPAKVDVLLHAVSYFCVANTYVDVGNYETEYNYFPVHFSPVLSPLPAPGTIAYAPKDIKWNDFPSIEYLFGVNTGVEDRTSLAGFYRIVREKGPVSIWRRKREFWPAAD
jgi:uncharacterized membrane protein (UPF0127 family)